MCEIKKHINGSSLLVWDFFESKILISAKTETPGKLLRNWINHKVFQIKKFLLMIFTIFKYYLKISPSMYMVMEISIQTIQDVELIFLGHFWYILNNDNLLC